MNTVKKLPEATALFWTVKILATTLGETGGDAVSMSLNLGYLISTGLFSIVFLASVLTQVTARKFNSFLYWTTVIATTTVGTTLADFSTRSLGLGYAGGSLILVTLLALSLLVWHWACGSVSVSSVDSRKTEVFYWVTIMFSQTLGTALGDWVSDTDGFGYAWAAALFGGALVAITIAYYQTKLSRTALFWSAFILTRPLGAVVGDWLDKPVDQGGMALSRMTASATLVGLVVLMLLVFNQRPAKQN